MSLSSPRPNGCKGCGSQYEVTEAQIDRILAKPMFSDEAYVVDEATYELRLSACRQCEHLLNEQTCVLCGCFVRVSAKLREKSCPNVRNKQWHSLTS